MLTDSCSGAHCGAVGLEGMGGLGRWEGMDEWIRTDRQTDRQAAGGCREQLEERGDREVPADPVW